MRKSFFRSTAASNSSSRSEAVPVVPRETDPLIHSDHRGTVRSRRSSPVFYNEEEAMRPKNNEGYSRADSQDQQQDEELASQNYSSSYYQAEPQQRKAPQHADSRAPPKESSGASRTSRNTRSTPDYRNIEGSYQRADDSQNSAEGPALLEIPEEVYTVRKAALKVMKPLIASWLVVSVGFAVTVLLGMARWTLLLGDVPFWFIFLPSWCSHIALLWIHIKSARALSKFIAEANENRQRPDSTDATDRTEYLPLLQRSLKFGLKTGLLSFCTLIFEVLLYLKIATGAISLWLCLAPLWFLVGGCIIDGIICKTQHFVRVLCWMLLFSAMVLIVLRMDLGVAAISWRIVISPIVAVLSICSGTLIYIVYGHQLGYYRLTEAQLTAGILYSMSALICVVLVVLVGEVLPMTRPVEVETRFFFLVMAPLIVCLTGMGAWAVSRDEYGRLLLYGGQAAVHPRKLRWEKDGWTCVQSKGVANIPMFGEVNFCPLDVGDKPKCIEICPCCSCYPYEDEDEPSVRGAEKATWQSHPYLAPTIPIRTLSRRGSGSSLGSSV